MSKIAITPNASGTGTINIVAPNTNTDRTLTIPDITGNVVTTGDTGSVADAMIATGITASKLTGDINYSNLPVGSVIQTVTNTGTSVVSTTSGSAQDVISASITPKFTNSIIHIEGYISRFEVVFGGNAYGAVYLLNPSGGGLTTAVAGIGSSSNANVVSMFANHSPNSTSSQTYKVAFSTASGSTTSVNTDGQRYSIRLMEIAQ